MSRPWSRCSAPATSCCASSRSRLDSDIHVRGNEITITGAPADNAIAVRLFEELLELIKAGQNLTPDAVARALGILTADTGERPAEVLSLNILSRRGKNIRPKTLNQKHYVDAIDKHTIVFGIGPAGTGKTYLAVAKAVQALQAKQVTRIILTRPAVEAGERLGFLPGTLYDKIDPYLRPLLDALHDMLDPESIPRLTQAGTIEIAPLAYMRGRTLNDAFIILDEAQNTTPEQMKMFLTRLGFGSKIVVTGDVTQVDLPGGTRSGLQVVRDILGDIDDVHFANLTSTDVVRHRLVGEIVDAYERYDAAQRPNGPASTAPTAPLSRAMSIEVNNESGVDGRRGARSPSSAASCSTRCGSTRWPSCRSCCSTPTRWRRCTAVDGPARPDRRDGLPDGRRGRSGSSGIDPSAPPGTDDDAGAALLGDVVLCPAVAAEQAASAGHSTEAELHLLCTHGILHLLGYDHGERRRGARDVRAAGPARSASWTARDRPRARSAPRCRAPAASEPRHRASADGCRGDRRRRRRAGRRDLPGPARRPARLRRRRAGAGVGGPGRGVPARGARGRQGAAVDHATTARATRTCCCCCGSPASSPPPCSSRSSRARSSARAGRCRC